MARRRFFVLLGWTVCVVSLVVGCASGVGQPPEVDLALHDPDVASLLQDLLDQAVENPGDAAARARLGLAYEAQGMTDAARAAYDQARALDDSEPRWHYHLARMLAARGDVGRALRRMDRVIELAPDYAPARWYTGQWLIESDQPVLAELAFRRALQSDPEAYPARVGLARAVLANDRPGEALDLLLAALQLYEADPYLHQLLGTAYRRLGRLEEAQKALELARPAKPAWDDPWRDEQQAYRIGFAADLKRAMNLLKGGEPIRAIPLLERLRQERPDDVTLLSNLGAAYLDVGRSAAGKQALLAALGHNPGHFASHLNLSVALEREGRPELALNHVERAIAANPFLVRAYKRKVRLLTRLGRFEDAAAAAETARSLEPGALR